MQHWHVGYKYYMMMSYTLHAGGSLRIIETWTIMVRLLRSCCVLVHFCIIQRVDGEEGGGGSGGYLPSSGQVGAVGIRERVGEGSDLIVPDGNFCSVSRIISFYHTQPLSIYWRCSPPSFYSRSILEIGCTSPLRRPLYLHYTHCDISNRPLYTSLIGDRTVVSGSHRI